jgi:hypothetical protein
MEVRGQRHVTAALTMRKELSSTYWKRRLGTPRGQFELSGDEEMSGLL